VPRAYYPTSLLHCFIPGINMQSLNWLRYHNCHEWDVDIPNPAFKEVGRD